MVENNQALEAYKVWLNASEKYDYHIVGIAGALTAWGVQTLQLKALDWTVAVEVAGLAALATSAALGLYRIERSILIHSLSLQKAQLTIKSNEKCARERRNQEEIGSADYVGVEKWEAKLREVDGLLAKQKPVALRLYKWRNFTLIAGLVAYSGGRVAHQLLHFTPT
ncbi:hypothetical protein [Duganella sp. FT27W]|uniref:hypothetical protein n=1 Tax=Duganella sp. FT27W TaxID=2654636 RepID=UPI00128BC62F|nr:hypothetical protein [Duganella sp. FT27W]MPQ57390.1 hypothetical protein [Duganella sp. FT27W]